MLGLSVRQAVTRKREQLAAERGIPAWNAEAVKTLGQDSHHPLFIAYPGATGLDDIATRGRAAASDDIARLGFAVAHEIDSASPAVEDLDDDTRREARDIASALMPAERPLVISGGSLESLAILDAAGNVARALARRAKPGGLSLVRREVNSTGVSLMNGQSLEWALKELAENRADAVVVLENDLYQRLPSAEVDRALNHACSLVVLDHQATPTLERAHLSLPAASFAEGDGTVISLEGRAQRFFQVYDPRYIRPETTIHESWRWLHGLLTTRDHDPVTDITFDNVTGDCAGHHPDLVDIVTASPDAGYRIEGSKLSREPHRYSGRTSMRAHLNVNEPRAPQDADTPFAFSMEGYSGFDHPHRDIPFAWAPGWNSPQAWNKFTDEVGGHLSAGNPGVRILHSLLKPESYSRDIPEAWQPEEGQWEAIVLPRLFGGEETSARAQPIEDRTPSPSLGIARSDARTLSISDNQPMVVTFSGSALTLPVCINEDLPSGLVTVPAGLAAELTTGMKVHLEQASVRGAS
jgi:NADH-quinone oxidoreductase subunit G